MKKIIGSFFIAFIACCLQPTFLMGSTAPRPQNPITGKQRPIFSATNKLVGSAAAPHSSAQTQAGTAKKRFQTPPQQQDWLQHRLVEGIKTHNSRLLVGLERRFLSREMIVHEPFPMNAQDYSTFCNDTHIRDYLAQQKAQEKQEAQEKAKAQEERAQKFAQKKWTARHLRVSKLLFHAGIKPSIADKAERSKAFDKKLSAVLEEARMLKSSGGYMKARPSNPLLGCATLAEDAEIVNARRKFDVHFPEKWKVLMALLKS